MGERHAINKINYRKNNINPIWFWHMHIKHYGMSNIQQIMMLTFTNVILLGGMWTSGLMDNATVSAKDFHKRLKIFKGIVRPKNFNSFIKFMNNMNRTRLMT